ncbi:MAG: Xaa-Pro dipeptidase [Thermoanaerobaculia bacterium]
MKSALADLYRAHVAERQRTTERALAETGFDRLLLHSGVPFTYFADDNDAPFHPTPHFAHWAPVEGPGHVLEIRPGKKPRLVRFQPRDYWYAPPQPAPDFVAAVIEVVETETPEAVCSAIGANGARTAFVGGATEEAAAFGVAADAVNPRALVARLDWERSYKSAYEVETLAEATVPAARGFRAAEEVFRDGATEMEAHHAFLAAAGVMEEWLPYPTIIGFDERSATLHYHGKRGTWAAPGKTMLVDAGVSVRGYGSDITRTFTGEGCDPLFVDLVAGMEALQKELAAAPRPGMRYLDLHVRAHVLIGDLLHRAGVLKVAGDAAVAKGLTRPFFPHGLGHFLGIQVHDVAGRFADREGTLAPPPPEYPALRTTRTIEEGMLFTIEPGLYFIPMLLDELRAGADRGLVDWALVDRLTPCGGIRVEDDVFVEADGVRNLTRPELP